MIRPDSQCSFVGMETDGKNSDDHRNNQSRHEHKYTGTDQEPVTFITPGIPDIVSLKAPFSPWSIRVFNCEPNHVY